MSFDSLVTSRPGYIGSRCASDFMGMAANSGFCVFFPSVPIFESDSNVNALGEERLSERN